MRLPENHRQFKLHTLEKLKTYCDTKIWPFDYDLFIRWLSNFDCPIEEYLALHILDSLIIRSKAMAISSYERLFYGELRQYLIDQNLIEPEPIKVWRDQLKKGNLSKSIRFSPINLSEDGESGHVVFRMLSGILNTNKYSLSKENIPKDLKVIILIDDILGSGGQFLDFALQFNLQKKLETIRVIYCPLVACEDGINTISKIYPSLKILPTECISKDVSIFSKPLSAPFKKDSRNSKSDAKEFLKKMKTKYSPNMPDWLGRNDAELNLMFEWGCPNQSLAILYMDYSSKKAGWNKLFARRA